MYLSEMLLSNVSANDDSYCRIMLLLLICLIEIGVNKQVLRGREGFTLCLVDDGIKGCIIFQTILVVNLLGFVHILDLDKISKIILAN